MKQCLFSVCFILLIATLCAQERVNLLLWYDKPARNWNEALPVGNGRLGAMIFGNVREELIQLNESTLWSGGPVKTNINPDAPAFLPQIRKALMQHDDYEKAIALTKKMQGLFTESYMPMADLVIGQTFKRDTVPSVYYRDLNIADAVSTTKYTMDGTEFTRQVFSSAPDQVIVIHINSDKPGQINMVADLKSLLHYRKSASAGNELILHGKAPAHVDPSYYNVNKEPVIYDDSSGCSGMRFETVVKAISNGVVYTDSTGIRISNASDVVLIVSAVTSFNGFDKCPDKEGKDEHRLAQDALTKAATKSYLSLMERHVADYQQYFNRVHFHLKDTIPDNSNASAPSDQRLINYTHGAYDPGIETLYFQFGRYLLISSSRPGGMAANLQGIWNKELRAPWSSNFTININTQMNYWPAEITNLAEMHAPLFELIKELAVTGAVTAKEFYGMKGWVAHHNSDLWAASNPVGDKGNGDPRWANWAQGGNWLCQHLWEHYRFSGDKQFLEKIAYPLMKSAAVFCLDWLVEDKSGWLVVAPSVSPENVFSYAPGKVSDVSVATTMDMSIVWDLFNNLIEASTVLNTDKDFRELLIARKRKLFPLQIGKKGNLQEWSKDYEDVEVHHRHVSHLFGLYPGRQIAPSSTPQFATAARKTLEIRGDEGTGWSKAWKINFWARLLDGDHAYLLVKDLLHATGESGTNYSGGGGTYPNFFDAHPPFQIDGNFGGTAGMAEMLLQSHLDEIQLLPALPAAWKEGHIKGLIARGAFEVELFWKQGRLSKAFILSKTGGVCRLRTKEKIGLKGMKFISTTTSLYSTVQHITSFNTVAGKTYELVIQ